MVKRVRKISVEEHGSRVRLSPELLDELGWRTYSDGFKCIGLFRRHGELLCAPLDAKGPTGAHPFQPAHDALPPPPPEEGPSDLLDIPSSTSLLAQDRIVEFETRWTGEKKQLTLKFGKAILNDLGWNPPESRLLYALSYSFVLIILSEERRIAVLDEDFTYGQMPG